jgi:hypothetical protein
VITFEAIVENYKMQTSGGIDVDGQRQIKVAARALTFNDLFGTFPDTSQLLQKR